LAAFHVLKPIALAGCKVDGGGGGGGGGGRGTEDETEEMKKEKVSRERKKRTERAASEAFEGHGQNGGLVWFQ
jgi:hypothetical protein